MSQYHVNEDEESVITFQEIGFIFAIFLFILYILLPGEMQKKRILAEKSNYELAAIYLENMLRIEPENTSLMLASIEVSIGNGNVDFAEKMLEALERTDKSKLQSQINLFRYQILQYRSQHVDLNATHVEDFKLEMKKLLNTTAKNKNFREEDAMIWYENAIFLEQKEAAFLFLKPFLGDTNNVYALEQCVYLPLGLKYEKEKQRCIEKLGEQKGELSLKWLIAAHSLYVQNKQYEKALEVVKKLVKLDDSYQDELARIQALVGDYKGSSDIYMLLYENSDEELVKKHYLTRAIETYVAAQLSTEAVALIKQYEDTYINDDEMTQKFIKYYLGLSELEAARELSIKLLDKDKK